MSPIELRHQSAVGQTGWAAFNWNYSASGPQLTFVAGCCDAARVQMDRYRRVLMATGVRFQWQVFGWSTKDFAFRKRLSAGGATTRANQRPQQTEAVDTAINNVRELRDDGPGGIVPGLWLNNFTNAPIAYQSNQVFANSYGFTPAAPVSGLNRDVLEIVQFDPLADGSGYATVRILVIGFHNLVWDLGASYPTT